MGVQQSGNAIVNLEVTCDLQYSERCERSRDTDVEVELDEHSMPVAEMAVANLDDWEYRPGGQTVCGPCLRVEENIAASAKR